MVSEEVMERFDDFEYAEFHKMMRMRDRFARVLKHKLEAFNAKTRLRFLRKMHEFDRVCPGVYQAWKNKKFPSV